MATAAGGMMMSKPQPVTRNQEATVYVGNLDEKTTEALLWELMVQAGPVVHVHIPRDRVTQTHQGYGFVEFQGEDDAEYAVKIISGIRLFGKPLRLNKSSIDKRSLDVGANLFVGNLAPDADEKLLFDTFILFGTLIQTPKVARDETTGVSRGFGFVSYDNFEAADAAIEAMNGQYLCNRPVTVNYAFKKDGKGERHGSAAERLLATQSRKASLAAGLAPPVTPSHFAQMQMQAGMATTSPMNSGGNISMPTGMNSGMNYPMSNPTMMMPPTTMRPNPGMPMAVGVNPPQMMYPTNVPTAMYYSLGFPTISPAAAMYPPLSNVANIPQYHYQQHQQQHQHQQQYQQQHQQYQQQYPQYQQQHHHQYQQPHPSQLPPPLATPYPYPPPPPYYNNNVGGNPPMVVPVPPGNNNIGHYHLPPPPPPPPTSK